MSRLFCVALFCGAAWGQTFYVATTGSDSNPCTVAQPCRTFAGALTSAHTLGVTYVALNAGDFGLGTTLASPNGGITIDGGPGVFMTGPADGSVITVGAAIATTPMVIRNVTIIPVGALSGGTGIGGTLNGGQALILDGVSIEGSGAGNTGVSLTATPGSSILLKNVSMRSTQYGISVSNSTSMGRSGTPGPFNALLDHVSVTGTALAAYLQDANVTIQNSDFTNNSGAAVACDASRIAPNWLIQNTTFTQNGEGLSGASACTIRVSNDAFVSNTTGIAAGGTMISFRNNIFMGNGTDGAPTLSTSFK